MKKGLWAVVLGLAVLTIASPSYAVPRLQTYIWWSDYVSDGVADQGTWVTGNRSFLVTTSAYWKEFELSNLYLPDARPAYDYIDTYLRIGVPTGETGDIFINGLRISSLCTTPPSSLLSSTLTGNGYDYRYFRLGTLSNTSVGALHFDHGLIHEPGWGSMRTTAISVSGYSNVLFDATGLDALRNTYASPLDYDAKFAATPEPGTLSLLGIGLLGAVPFLRKRRKK